MPHQPMNYTKLNVQAYNNYIYNLFYSKTKHAHTKSSFSNHFYNISIQIFSSFLQYLTYIPQQSAGHYIVLPLSQNITIFSPSFRFVPKYNNLSTNILFPNNHNPSPFIFPTYQPFTIHFSHLSPLFIQSQSSITHFYLLS